MIKAISFDFEFSFKCDVVRVVVVLFYLQLDIETKKISPKNIQIAAQSWLKREAEQKEEKNKCNRH